MFLLPEHEQAFNKAKRRLSSPPALTYSDSRFLTSTESRYAMIAMKKCDMFIWGLPHFKLVTDRQALIPILDSKGIADVNNPRLHRSH